MNKTLKRLAVLALTLTVVTVIGCKKQITVEPEPPPPPPPPPVVEAPPPPPPPVIDIESIIRNALSTVYFEYDRSDLRPDAINALGRAGQAMREYTSVRVMAEGHADERGTSAYNMGLGEARARAVRDYLVSYGISADRVEVTSYGKERPANPNCGGNEACHGQNRRVEWRILSF